MRKTIFFSLASLPTSVSQSSVFCFPKCQNNTIGGTAIHSRARTKCTVIFGFDYFAKNNSLWRWTYALLVVMEVACAMKRSCASYRQIESWEGAKTDIGLLKQNVDGITALTVMWALPLRAGGYQQSQLDRWTCCQLSVAIWLRLLQNETRMWLLCKRVTERCGRIFSWEFIWFVISFRRRYFVCGGVASTN